MDVALFVVDVVQRPPMPSEFRGLLKAGHATRRHRYTVPETARLEIPTLWPSLEMKSP